MITELLLTAWFWFGFSVISIIFEVVFGASFFLLWLGVVAAIVGGISWVFVTLLWQIQLLIFAFGSVISIAGWYYYLKTHRTKTDRPTLNRRAEQYMGRTFTLSEPIVNGRGKIRVDDSTWRVEGEDLLAGTVVQVVGVDSVTLKVKPKNTDL